MAKTARKWTLEELKEKAEPALAVEELVLIVINQPQDKINLSQVDQQAFEYVFRKTNDLQKAKKLSKAARFLAMMRRDYSIEGNYFVDKEFARKLQEEKKPEPKPEPKDVDIELLGNITFARYWETNLVGGVSFRFQIPAREISDWGITTVAKLLSAVMGVTETEVINPHRGEVHSQGYLQSFLIKILEEKFGMKIKICGNCKYRYIPNDRQPAVFCTQNGVGNVLHNYSDVNCEANGFKENSWTPKEISEETPRLRSGQEK